MPERPRGFDESVPPEVKHGIISQEDYDYLARAMEAGDLNAWKAKAVPLCEDNVPLFAILFLNKDPMPHAWSKWDLVRRHNQILVRWPRGHGKALALDTPIPTPTGWTTMGALRTGDEVLDSLGRPTKILDAKPILYNRPCFRVTFNDGTSIVADEDHIWHTRTKEERNYRRRRQGKRIRVLHPGDLRTTAEIRASLLVSKGSSRWKEYNHSVDVAPAWDLPEQDLLIDPYCLGAWLGDGHSNGAILSSADLPVLEQFAKAGYPVRRMKQPYGWSISDGKRTGRRQQFDTFLGKLRRLGVLKNKHIPDQYLIGSAAQRLALLQGLMDTDGTCSKGGQLTFTSTLPHLADQVERLVASLGFVPHRWTKYPTIPGHPEAMCKPAYEVSFITKEPVFRLQRKLERQQQATKNSYTGKTRTIVSVEPVPSVPVRCIGVEARDGMFLAGNGSIPTHNTDLFTSAMLTHRIAYSVIPQGYLGCKGLHEDPQVLAIFESRDRANDRMLAVRQVFETGGPGGLIGKVFRGCLTFPGGEPTPWADMSIPDMAAKFGLWNNYRVFLPHPRRMVKSDPNVAAITPKEGSVGFQPSLVIADDVVGPTNADSQAKRLTLNKWWGKAIEQIIKPYTRFLAPHTVMHPDDLNHELAKTGVYYLMELKALDRFPDRDDFEEVIDPETGTIVDIRLTPRGETLKPLFGCPTYTEADCPFKDESHVNPKFGGIMHRPVKDLIFQWRKRPLEFSSQYMHVLRSTESTSIKPWMLRFFCQDPDCKYRCLGKVASYHAEWADWVTDHPDAGLPKEAPKIVRFNRDGLVKEKDRDPIPIEISVHGWDLAFGSKRINDRTVCARIYRTVDKQYFVIFEKGRWKYDSVWRKVVSYAVTDPLHKPLEVALEVDNEQIYPEEVKKLMLQMGVQDRFKLTEITRTKEKDIVFHNSGLPIAMSNGFVYVDIHDEDAVNELLQVTPDQSGGHDDCLDALVNGYGRIRGSKKLTPGWFGKPLPAR